MCIIQTKECLLIKAKKFRLDVFFLLFQLFFFVCLLVNFGVLGVSEGPEGLQMNTGLNPVVDQRQRMIFGDLGKFSTSE